MNATLRVAFGTDDNHTLKQERFGDSMLFRIVTVKDDTVAATELRENTFSDPAIENKPPKILELLRDCDIFVGRSWRAGSFTLFTDNGKLVFISEIEPLDEIISAILVKDFTRMKVFSPTVNKFISPANL